VKEQEITFTVREDDEDAGKRVDKVIRNRVSELSRTKGQALIKAGAVLINNRPCEKPAQNVGAGDRVTVTLPEEPDRSVGPEPIPLDVIHEDEQLLVVNKPAGMVVHPAPGHPGGTLVNAVLHHCPEIAGVGHPERPGIVHRLDKETSGVLVIAKDEATLTALQRQFKRREVAKSYLALVEGQVQPPEGIVEVPIGRDEQHRQRMAATRSGRYARTLYRTVERFKNQTLLKVHPYTGRTHQIRVHLSWLGYPVLGDDTYGYRRQELLDDRHFLHASRLRIVHPGTGDEVTFEAPLPQDLSDVLRRLR
jgi:23S rRNA pseudouridine1911/1915/1917 synthase